LSDHSVSDGSLMQDRAKGKYRLALTTFDIISKIELYEVSYSLTKASYNILTSHF
jgi:hypothetical protein